MALAEVCQFVAFLDADNWYHEGRIASLLSLYKDTHSPVCCSFRTFHSIEGSTLNAKEIDEDNLACRRRLHDASQRCFQSRNNVGAYAKKTFSHW